MERLYIHLKEASLSPIGDRKPSTKREFRASFVKRCKNRAVNDKLHHIRALNSTLKVHEFLENWELIDVDFLCNSFLFFYYSQKKQICRL